MASGGGLTLEDEADAPTLLEAVRQGRAECGRGRERVSRRGDKVPRGTMDGGGRGGGGGRGLVCGGGCCGGDGICGC